MLISHLHRFIYTKTFKTAGTSVESYFEPYCMGPDEWALSHDREAYESAYGVIGYRGPHIEAGMRWWNHMPAAEVKAAVGDAIWQRYYKFCVVRNPFDRAVSAFYFARSKGRLPPSDAPDPVQMERWLAAGGLRMDRDQYLIDGRLVMDRVVRHERLHADLQDLCDTLELPWQPERLPTFKAGIRPAGAPLDELYTPRARALVASQCAYELDQFGYAFPAPLPVAA